MDENILDFLMYSNLGQNNFYKGTYASNELNLYKIHISNFDKSKCIGFICNTLRGEFETFLSSLSHLKLTKNHLFLPQA